MTKDEALKLALEALQPTPYKDDWTVAKETNKAITAIKDSLAQPEQEPVVCDCDSPSWCKQYKKCNRKMLGFMPYVAQPQRTWVGLTDEDFLEACQIAERGNYLVAFQRIQAKLRSKNESKN